MSERGQDEAVERRERGYVDASEVSWAVRALQRAQIELDRALADRMGLRALDYAAMTFLLQSTHPPGPVELATWLGISTGSGTELADRLERSGHLHRRRAVDDRRRIVLELDHDAVAAMVDRLRPLFADLERVADTFTEDERAVITRYLEAVTDRTHAHADSLRPG
jgi:MarR family transcriptional regulator, organic hydroperoxide resistance regulator